MIPAALLAFLDGAWKFLRNPVVLGAAAVFAFGQWQYSRGEAFVRAEWAAENERLAEARGIEKAEAEADAREKAKIQEAVNEAHDKQVAAILAINDDLARRMQRGAIEAGAVLAAARARGAASPAPAEPVPGSLAGGRGNDGPARDAAARVEAALTANAAAIDNARRQCLLDAADRDALVKSLLEREIVKADQFPGHAGHAH